LSTRAQLGFYESKDVKLEDWQTLLYRHSGCCPESVLPDIIPFLTTWRRLGDSEYLSARLLQHLTNSYDEMKADAKEYKGILGYGISQESHRDILYYYRIDLSGIRVCAANFDDNNEPDFKLIKTEAM